LNLNKKHRQIKSNEMNECLVTTGATGRLASLAGLATLAGRLAMAATAFHTKSSHCCFELVITCVKKKIFSNSLLLVGFLWIWKLDLEVGFGFS